MPQRAKSDRCMEPSSLSQIDDHVANRLRAADEDVAIRWFVERLWSISDFPGDQTALTAMTHAGPTRPSDWHVARFGQFQNALVGRRLPVCGDPASRERDERTCACFVFGRMRTSGCCADNTRSHLLAAVEDFDMNPLRLDAERRERFFHIRHEAIRAAEVDFRVSRNARRVEDRSRQVTL